MLQKFSSQPRSEQRGIQVAGFADTFTGAFNPDVEANQYKPDMNTVKKSAGEFYTAATSYPKDPRILEASVKLAENFLVDEQEIRNLPNQIDGLSTQVPFALTAQIFSKLATILAYYPMEEITSGVISPEKLSDTVTILDTVTSRITWLRKLRESAIDDTARATILRQGLKNLRYELDFIISKTGVTGTDELKVRNESEVAKMWNDFAQQK